MKYVLDASVAIKWVIVEPDSNKAIRLREDYRNRIHDLLAPESFTIECAYSLTKKQRQRLLSDARALWDEIMMDAPALAPTLPLMDRALDISIATRHNYYDCVYGALAEREGCELLTADAKLIANLQASFPFITSLARLPWNRHTGTADGNQLNPATGPERSSARRGGGWARKKEKHAVLLRAPTRLPDSRRPAVGACRQSEPTRSIIPAPRLRAGGTPQPARLESVKLV
jgi:predicted nucleic acid-binding protein